MVRCTHIQECTSHPSRCNTCRNNTGKKDYYKPNDFWEYEPYRHEPLLPRWHTEQIYCRYH